MKHYPEIGSSGKIRGTFVDFSELTHKDYILLGWTKKQWQEEMEDMKKAGIDRVILARTMRYGCVYYFSRFFETTNEIDYLSPFMNAAEETGMEVFISGMISDHFFRASDADFVRMMKRDVYIYHTVICELLEIYAQHPSLKGIYISHEADNVNLASPTRKEAAREFFGNLYKKVKKETSLPILSSPFFTKDVKPEELAAFWEEFLDRPMFDIIAMQDGAGCDRSIFPEDIAQYFPPLSKVFQQKNIAFWHNIETFSFNPGFAASNNDRSKIWLHPAPLDRVDRQYEAGKPFVKDSITWEFGHFLSRKQVGEDWYEAFRQWNLA